MSTPAPPDQTILLDVTDGAATLTLNRPDDGNLFDLEMAEALRAAAEQVAARDDVRVVVLRGAGKAFCLGGDIGFFGAAEDPGATLDEMAGHLHASLAALAAGDAPIVAVVHGPAYGVGLSLAAFADVVVAGASARFLAGYPNVGLTPDGGMTWTLPRKVGAARAADILLSGTRLTAEQALAAGLVSAVVPDDELREAATARVRALAAGPTAAFGAIRRLLDDGARATFPEHLAAERGTIAAQASSTEGREGVAAFTEGRRPRFGAPAGAAS